MVQLEASVGVLEKIPPKMMKRASGVHGAGMRIECQVDDVGETITSSPHKRRPC